MALHVPTDPETGFPKLPEGYFFRVTKFNAFGYTYRVRVCRMILGRLIFHTVGSSLARGKPELRDAAWNAHNDWRKELARKRSLDWSVLGDYPPKKWGAW